MKPNRTRVLAAAIGSVAAIAMVSLPLSCGLASTPLATPTDAATEGAVVTEAGTGLDGGPDARPLYVFVTSGRFSGDLVAAAKSHGAPASANDGLAAADFLCMYYAQISGVAAVRSAPGWTAWLGTDSVVAGKRLWDADRAQHAYARVDGQRVFAPGTDLWSHDPFPACAVPIAVTEAGNPLGPTDDGHAWTGTLISGETANACANWTTSGQDADAATPMGQFGVPTEPDAVPQRLAPGGPKLARRLAAWTRISTASRSRGSPRRKLIQLAATGS